MADKAKERGPSHPRERTGRAHSAEVDSWRINQPWRVQDETVLRVQRQLAFAAAAAAEPVLTRNSTSAAAAHALIAAADDSAAQRTDCSARTETSAYTGFHASDSSVDAVFVIPAHSANRSPERAGERARSSVAAMAAQLRQVLSDVEAERRLLAKEREAMRAERLAWRESMRDAAGLSGGGKQRELVTAVDTEDRIELTVGVRAASPPGAGDKAVTSAAMGLAADGGTELHVGTASDGSVISRGGMGRVLPLLTDEAVNTAAVEAAADANIPRHMAEAGSEA